MTTLVINRGNGERVILITPIINPEGKESLNLIKEDVFNKPEIEVNIPTNIYETENEYEIELLAPGLEKTDIELELEDDVLTVSANCPPDPANDDPNLRRLEFITRGFSRSFRLPADSSPEEIAASYINGIIFLSISKKAGKIISENLEIFNE